jgi:hypothetical protein
MNYALAAQRQNAAAAGVARVRTFGVCSMASASWSVRPIAGVDTDPKHEAPRWHRVSS